MNYGFVKVAVAVPSVSVANCSENARAITNMLSDASNRGASIVLFPELCITAYTCGDLFVQQLLLDEAEEALLAVVDSTVDCGTIAIVGMPLRYRGVLLNVAVVIQGGVIRGIVPKVYLPNYKEFYEQRWFASGADYALSTVQLCGQSVPIGTDLIFDNNGVKFGVEVCEDLWAPIPPSSYLALRGADIVFNLSASTEVVGKHDYLCSLIAQQSSRCICGYVYASCGFGESTTDVVFAGNGMIYENGALLARGERFALSEQLVMSEIDVERIRTERRINTTFAASIAKEGGDCRTIAINAPSMEVGELTRYFEPHPFVPKGDLLNERCEEIFSIQTMGLAKRIVHTRAQSVVIGISGGLDSTLALLVCVKTFDKLGLDRSGIVGVTMPGFGTTQRTRSNALSLMELLGVTVREISIREACLQHFEDIGHDVDVHDVVYENSQARERTQLLMDIANQTGGLVIGTGDMSELALGWATYNGDHMSMYGVNAGVPKTLVKHLVKWVAEYEMGGEVCAILLDVIDTPISPELIPADENDNITQVTEDLVGPYELHDFYLYYMVRCSFAPSKVGYLASRAFEGVYTDDVIRKWLKVFCRRFFNQQFKRSCLPDGPKVGSVSLSPRGDWRMPSDANGAAWQEDADRW